MNIFTHQLVKCAAAAFECAEPIIEIGSLQYESKGQDVDLRTLFPGKAYIGCDLAPGPGVDRVEDLTKLTFKDAEAGTVLCLHILEHVWDVFAATRHIRRVVRSGGMAIIVCPFDLHIHRFPKDYWRFTDDCMRKLMEEFPWLIIGRHGYSHMPQEVFGIGFNRSTFPDFDARLQDFQKRLEREAHDPGSWLERFRMWVGSGLFKKKHFKPFFARNELTYDIVKPAGPV